MLNYFEMTVPVFTNGLAGLKNVLLKGEAFAKENGLSDEHMLSLRLAPDMFPLVKQVQITCDYAKGTPARMTGKEVQKIEDIEKTFADLHTRIDKTLEILQTFTEKDFIDAAARKIKIAYFPADMHFTGDGYMRFYALPNFFFHMVTTYDILRANGVPLGKADFAGTLPLIKD